ncbi:MAG: hypothetical protein ACXVCJ_27425 [Polyangiales bacterium]
MLSHRNTAIVLALLGIGAGALIFATRDDDKKPAPIEPLTSVATAVTTNAPPPPMPVAAAATDAASPTASATEKTADALSREGIEAAVMAKDPSALPSIEKVDLTKDGHVAAAAIDAVGKLAAMAPEPAKKEAVRTLADWLRQESKRGTNDAKGNVSILVDSLADTGSDEAIKPLVDALDSASYPLHIETRIVQSLERLDAKSAAPSVERFAARVGKLAPTDEMEKALAKEAVDEANAALAKWK